MFVLPVLDLGPGGPGGPASNMSSSESDTTFFAFFLTGLWSDSDSDFLCFWDCPSGFLGTGSFLEAGPGLDFKDPPPAAIISENKSEDLVSFFGGGFLA